MTIFDEHMNGQNADPNAVTATAEMSFEQLHYHDELQEASRKRYQWLRDHPNLDPGDPLLHPEYVRLRLTESTVENMYLRTNIDALANRTRTAKHRQLGKQYGVASETIRQLKGELALAREQINRMVGDHHAEINRIKAAYGKKRRFFG